jgi:hypothetical protein
VELDFLYPSEGIHRRWENNYRITATAATPDQAAFILSVPRRKPPDETQETLRTSDFPSTHVKVEIVHLIFMYFLLITLLHAYLIYFRCRKNGRRTSILHLFLMGEQFHEWLIFFDTPADIILTFCKILFGHHIF